MGVHWANSTMGVVMGLSESEPGAAFPGVIGRTTDVSCATSPSYSGFARPVTAIRLSGTMREPRPVPLYTVDGVFVAIGAPGGSFRTVCRAGDSGLLTPRMSADVWS